MQEPTLTSLAVGIAEIRSDLRSLDKKLDLVCAHQTERNGAQDTHVKNMEAEVTLNTTFRNEIKGAIALSAALGGLFGGIVVAAGRVIIENLF